MKRLTFFVFTLASLPVAQMAADEIYTPGESSRLTYKGFALDFIDNYCIDCHDDAESKGGLSLEKLGRLI